MTATAIRKKLINYLESADEKKVKAVYTIFEDEINESSEFFLTKDQLDILNKERENHLKGKSKSYTWDQAKEIIRSKKK
jgi:hypothetical protein